MDLVSSEDDESPAPRAAAAKVAAKPAPRGPGRRAAAKPVTYREVGSEEEGEDGSSSSEEDGDDYVPSD